MSFFYRDDNFFLLRLTRPFPSRGVGMEQDFSPAPQGRTEMVLDFLDPTCPTLPHLDKG